MKDETDDEDDLCQSLEEDLCAECDAFIGKKGAYFMQITYVKKSHMAKHE